MDTAPVSGTTQVPQLRSIPGDPMCQGLLPLGDWVRQQEESGDEDACPACDLATIAPWYRDLLQRKGYPELAARVQGLADEEDDAAKAAALMDEVKEAVQDEETQRELLGYDCMVQRYTESLEEV